MAPAATAEQNLAECPFCRETIKAGAIKCKHCQSMLVPLESTAQAARAKVYQPRPGGQPRYGHGWSLLILSFILFGAIAGSIETDADGGRGAFFASLIIVGPWAAWLLSQSGANKVLPILGLILIGLGGMMALFPA